MDSEFRKLIPKLGIGDSESGIEDSEIRNADSEFPDLTLPVNGSQILSAELRAQLTSLKALIDSQAAQITALQTQVTNGLASRPTFSEMNDQSAANVNSVDTFNTDPQDPPVFDDYVALRDKLNALISTLWR